MQTEDGFIAILGQSDTHDLTQQEKGEHMCVERASGLISEAHNIINRQPSLSSDAAQGSSVVQRPKKRCKKSQAPLSEEPPCKLFKLSDETAVPRHCQQTFKPGEDNRLWSLLKQLFPDPTVATETRSSSGTQATCSWKRNEEFCTMKETLSSEESPSDVFNQEKVVAKYLEVEPTICPQEFTPVPENYPLGFANRAFPDTIADTKRSPGLQVTRSLEMNNFKAMERFIFLDLASCPLFFKNFRGLFMDKTFVFGLTKPCCSIKFTKHKLYCELTEKKCVHISNDIGDSKISIGFALALLIPKMDDRVSASLPFYIISNTDGLNETVRQLGNGKRKIKLMTAAIKEAFSSNDFTI
ncbi:uncharacterized protein LOC106065588 isoform X2 [Biomphalaria glabrata]|nr:uncharacterized protein LOC106065588 isoform X2 [Biomphalaria glabrata]XP_055898176.1 uncharacterized protein LOC106065588 isoform X2 [Biomphalaria glabrata]XP_055898177.1 uncharacterized protein LOC106065588 isoform X2 [Biomphalaria glabrata]